MRKAQKEQAQNFIQLLDEAHSEILNNLQKKNYEPVLVTLADCQDGAIALGNLIEAAEGEGFVTISYLEKYCEVIFQIYNGISEGQFVDVVKIEKSLRKALDQIANSVRDDIRVRREVVFFPYKASMWDSLESVYLAAKDDPDCDAFCVPIPYFDRNADGSLGQMHYEGNEYPKNIEVTSYLAYSVEVRRPDAIYIHNPYDDYNRVTSVHPNFYSSRLKNFTDELVYIPYFVLSEIEPEDEAAVEANKHFFSVPAVFHAHKVIVQSEKMRQVYIKSLTKQFGEESRSVWEEKILGLGSPKFDKVLNTKKEDLEIPEEWLKIIEKPDGSHKKIIFYNTSIGALLEHNEKMLEKMKSVFETFKENKDEVALLWRPHPLIQSTIQSMRPQLWEQYKAIVEKYRAEGWGIYDDSADLDRAIVLSDAYYGDHSSVVELCREKGMPVMVQNVEIHSYNMQIELEGAIKDEDIVWVCPSYMNRLVALDAYTSEVMECYEIPVNEKYVASGCFCSMELIGRKIYLIPFFEKKIFAFDLASRTFSAIGLDKTIIYNMKIMFIASRVYKQYLFMICADCPMVVRLNTIDNSILYMDKLEENEHIELLTDGRILFAQQNVLYKEKIFAPLQNKSAVLEIDCEELRLKLHNIQKKEDGYGGICCFNDNILLAPLSNGYIVKWNVITGNVGFIETLQMSNDNNSYIGVGVLKKAISLFPRGNIREGIIKGNVCIMQGGYSYIREDEDVITSYEYMKGKLQIYFKKLDRCENIEIKIPDSILNIDRTIENGKATVYENRNINLVRMLRYTLR